MDTETIKKQHKVLKNKAKAAKKEGKRQIAVGFARGAARLERMLKAANPKKKRGAKEEAAAEAPAAPAAS